MSFSNSAGVYPRIVDRSFAVSGSGLLVGGVVITAKKGPTEPTYVSSAQQFIDLYGLPSKDNPSMYAALRFLNRAPALTVVRVVNDATIATGDLTESASTVMSFSAANPGVWGNGIAVSFGDIAGTSASSSMFAVSVKLDGVEVERFEVSRDPELKNGFGNSVYIEDVINGRSAFITVSDDVTFPVDSSWDKATTVTLSGGTDDTSVASEGDIITAYELMTNTDDVEAQILINAGWATVAVQQAMDQVARVRDDAVAILDVPQMSNDDVEAMVEYVTAELMLDSHLSGIYGGWVKVYDQYNDREVTIPSSGDVAAIFVETQSESERWDAPAGTRRGVIRNALGVSKVFNEAERDLLYVNNINPVTTYAGAAAIVWGQKTLLNATSALDRFNVVNSLLWMQGRMTDALRPFVFEANTQFTRDSAKYLLDSFLENIQTRGGLYDFFVDMSNNTPEVIDRNEMIVDVRLQPVRTAEFIRLNLIVDRTGISYGS